ncbi:aminotransferase class III-fold pyridoxal phosphate-dependent enzyme [Cereibacter sphaeroides]|jgi:adenosylmethionine-8-amino-7-oxononanoate aminotransferase|uniref:Aminotransferase class III-fold pyridoxal phosphate-dependent enzyme n=1 Tax=Cereibacter sphaeroides TaxID=1063 RepID=A0AAX1UEZ7_CERSP|nr:aminotransferase [Cereibacter sphaeroides]ABN77136.1 aminotransferase [Cereibacter sphaeroides ATCC 17029]AZB63257.1 aminotransferase class III-fold pyridoxal phosphate-dependent enzyme [Cereibacter sphaeroides]AZB68826.1 aminotransferase class III-fold pyridoxal phosphate-dependent enzyme [Cereibacter sphaeroides]MWP40288.1 aminotransferase class III-fold pyridoxal phosphate-dependent enzyme [Cereibacter sphaeroides]RHZ90758.1 aminotransferase class III-fold pyridoxal phosphate-dependent e
MRDDAPNSWESRADASSFYGFTDLPSVHQRGTVVLTHGKGPYIYDVHGRAYLDANSGLWNMVAGFDHPGLIEAAKAQYERFPGYHAFFGRMSDQTVMLSEKLVEVSPFARGRVFYTNSGSEANDTMVKMLWFLGAAEGHPERRKIITRVNSYHGVTAVSASMTGKPYNSLFGLPLPGFIHVGCPHYWRFGQAGETEAEFTQRLARELEATIIKEGPDTIAGFFAEPVMGAGGVIPPSEGYFQAIQPVLQRYGIPLIADEVICGFGRTGNTWGCQTYDFMPDAIISSKNITAGFFPMGAVILGPELADRLQAASEAVEEFPHGFTASGHPVGCAIALKAIDVVMNEGLAENVRALTPKFEAGLAYLAENPNIGEWRGKGLMGALEAVKDKATKTPFPGDLSVSERIANSCTDHGLICRPLGQSIVLCPPFIMTEAQMDEMFEKLGAALKKVFAEVA